MLKYIGQGNFTAGIPARDLTDDDVKRAGGAAAVLKTGLYERVESKKLKGGEENK